MRFLAALAAGALAVTASGGAVAATVTIDFDELADNVFIDNQFASEGIIFNSAGGGVRTLDFNGADTGRTAIGGTNNAGMRDFRELVEFSFFDGAAKATTDFVSVAFTDLELTGNSLTAFDVDGNELGSVIAPCAADFSCNLIEIVSISIAGIHRIVLDGAGGRGQADVAFDTIVFNEIGEMSEIPIPAAAPIFMMGAAAIGFARRRRRAA